MKLFELIKTQHNPNLKQGTQQPAMGNASSHAEVSQDPEDPHMVKRETDHRDPHSAYIKALLGSKQLMASNPYFPRVYETNEDGGRVVIKMEKLFELATARPEEIDAFARRIFGKGIKELQAMPVLAHARDNPTHAFISAIERISDSRRYSNLTDKHFVQALQLIDKLKDSHDDDVHMDLHDENFMIRRGPNGAQLVIADPLGGVVT